MAVCHKLINPRLVIAGIKNIKISLKTFEKKKIFLFEGQSRIRTFYQTFFLLVNVNNLLKCHGSFNFEL